jgi:hypothetical protein
MTPGSGGETSSVIGTIVAARKFYSDEAEAKKRWIVMSKISFHSSQKNLTNKLERFYLASLVKC